MEENKNYDKKIYQELQSMSHMMVIIMNALEFKLGYHWHEEWRKERDKFSNADMVPTYFDPKDEEEEEED